MDFMGYGVYCCIFFNYFFLTFNLLGGRESSRVVVFLREEGCNIVTFIIYM